jgi:hypothetical protein
MEGVMPNVECAACHVARDQARMFYWVGFGCYCTGCALQDGILKGADIVAGRIKSLAGSPLR